MDVLHHNFIRLGLTRAKALQTASRLERDIHHRFAAPKSNAFALHKVQLHVEICLETMLS